MNFIPGDWVIVISYPNTLLNGVVGQVVKWTSDHYVLTKFTKGRLHMLPSEIKPWVCRLGGWKQ